jgi:hypothetical protein
MSKSNDISNMATLDDHRPLADSELDAVTGGTRSYHRRQSVRLRNGNRKKDSKTLTDGERS